MLKMDAYKRKEAALWLKNNFEDIYDKEQAWNDLKTLTKDNYTLVRGWAALALGTAFCHVPDEKDAWNTLEKLTKDGDRFVRGKATQALGIVFPNVSNKKRAWKALARLTKDNDSFVKEMAARALGTSFPYIPEKEEAVECLDCLLDDSTLKRVHVTYALGNIFVYRASKAESPEIFKEELENALTMFEETSKAAAFSDPAKFCFPFYRSFYTITFKKSKDDEEIQKYIEDAYKAVQGSESRKKLIEAVENLANALKWVQNSNNLDEIMFEFEAYSYYCERAVELLDDTKGRSPNAWKIIEKGIPIIDENIHKTIIEIQNKSKELCKSSKGTYIEPLGRQTAQNAIKLSMEDKIQLKKDLSNLTNNLHKFCSYLPGDKKRHACEEIKNINELDTLTQVQKINEVADYIYTNFRIPPIIDIHISDAQKEIVKVAAIQISFELTQFPQSIVNKEKCKEKIISALNIAKSEGVNIACLPELCMSEEWISYIRDRYPEMIIIGGSYYKNNFNKCPIIMEESEKMHYQSKKSPSRFEDPEITGYGMKSGDEIFKYSTQFGTFSVLICRDLMNYAKICDDIDFIFCPAFNSANERFHSLASNHVADNPSYIIISNTAIYGGTSIFGQLHRDFFKHLINSNCKKEGDNSYKLCELKEGVEGLIIADFDLIHKTPQIQTPINPQKEIKSVKNIKKMQLYTLQNENNLKITTPIDN